MCVDRRKCARISRRGFGSPIRAGNARRGVMNTRDALIDFEIGYSRPVFADVARGELMPSSIADRFHNFHITVPGSHISGKAVLYAGLAAGVVFLVLVLLFAP